MKQEDDIHNPIHEAVQIAGGQTALAKIVGVKQPTIFKWLKRGVIPPRKVLAVEKATGVSRHKLNPFIYPI